MKYTCKKSSLYYTNVVVIFVTYEKICEYIYDIPKFTKKNGLEHTKKLLEYMGNPQRKFEVIHVAGSNGKGSVCAFISSVLVHAGKQTGLFISPHLVCMEERFQINGRNCSREDFIEAFEVVKAAVDKMQKDNEAHPSFFEFLFAMGMHIFASYKLDYVILETGLGGRLDVTNLFEEPLMTIITSISLEHTEYLGDTIAQIAGEKAGIIKEGVPVVFDGKNEEAATVIRDHARACHAPFYEINPKNLKIQEITGKTIDFSYESDYDVVNLRIPFVAEYQVMNAALAYKALQLLQTTVGIYPSQIIEGIRQTIWPGRMQPVQEHVYFDGAHNADGLAEFLNTASVIGGEHPLLLFSMVREKDYHKGIELLAKGVDWEQVILTKIPDVRGLEPDILAEEFQKHGVDTMVIRDCNEAFVYAMKHRKEDQTLFCAGSLYLIGELEKIAGGIRND